MKKIILFVSAIALTMSISACSSNDDDGGTGGKVTATVDGVAKTFDVVVVNAETITEQGETYKELTVVATSSTSATEGFTFYLDQEDTGSDVIYDFRYLKNNVGFFDSGSMTSSITTNTANGRLKGTFSGTLNGLENNVVVTNGTLDIRY
ncbi:hypothetical protein [Flavobacterium sp. 3HN19-14]|uniref:hypothetical protein n=1 Tax=Flavobacterium sp. 3HN19-14 TaxID=3448133 RepID=UPI003EE3DE1F